jgi:hypothetical protein
MVLHELRFLIWLVKKREWYHHRIQDAFYTLFIYMPSVMGWHWKHPSVC